jgi:hypothetical protein
MSSETSTERVRPKPDQSTLEPWQFFVLAGLGCATAALFASRGQGVTAVVLLTILMGATALVGLAVLRTLRPLDTGRGYREQIERDLAKRLGQATPGPAAAATVTPTTTPTATTGCPSCATVNDPDARFCKACGYKL